MKKKILLGFKIQHMKRIFITLFFIFYTSILFAQQIINERTYYKDGKEIKLVTTRRGDKYNPFQEMLTPGHETKKIRMQDSINNSDFEVKFYLEKYVNNVVEKEDKALHTSFKSTYVNELIINRMTNDWLSIFMQTPSFNWAYYLYPEENSRYKWKIFKETPFEKDVPIFLIYCENPDDDSTEKNIEKLFTSPSFINLNDKDKIVKQIKAISDHFYLFLYDVISKNK